MLQYLSCTNEKGCYYMSQENKRIIELFAQPNTMDKKVKKVFYRGRFRLFLTDEIGYRAAFLFGRI